MTTQPVELIELQLGDDCEGLRLDQALARLVPAYSRSQLQSWIRAGRVRVEDQVSMVPRQRVSAGARVRLEAVAAPRVEADRAQPIPLRVVFEDEDLIVIDKPAGLVVHPAAGNPDGTLLNALLHHAPELGALPRAGLVHRLDKDTTGLMVVARSLRAHTALVRQLQDRSLLRIYRGVVTGTLVAGGQVEAPVGRHPRLRQRMAVVVGGREALTHYRIRRRFRAHTELTFRLATGRTHQIRVHMAHLRRPLVGDPLYGGRMILPSGAGSELAATLRGFGRQALHATTLGLVHPGSGSSCEWRADPPADYRRLLQLLEEDGVAHDRH